MVIIVIIVLYFAAVAALGIIGAITDSIKSWFEKRYYKNEDSKDF